MIWDLMSFQKNIALEEGDQTYTYEDLFQITEDICSHISERSLVFIVCRNVLGSIAGYVGFLNHNIVPLMLEEKIDQNLLEELIIQYRPAYLWVPIDQTDNFGKYTKLTENSGYVLLKTNITDSYAINDDLALLINTSGSVGKPKLVRQSYNNIIANARSIIEYLSIDSKEKAITSLPMNYVYGLSVINSHLMAGASIVMTEYNCYEGKFWRLFNEKQATSFSGVPFMYEMLYKLKITKKELPTLITMTQAGGKLSPELQDFFAHYADDNNKRFFVMYGASEATSRMGYLPYQDAIRKRGSIGIPIPGGRYELIDENDKLITETNKTGELVYYGDNVTMGYATCGDDLIKSDEWHGRLNTGDMAYRDDEGYYYITGRKKRFIKILGKRLSLDETEMRLRNIFNTIDLACAGSDDNLRVFIVDDSLKERINEYLMNTSHINPGHFRIQVIQEIPKNAAGKTLYGKLNEMEY